MNELIKIISTTLKNASLDHTVNTDKEGAQFDITMDNGTVFSMVIKRDKNKKDDIPYFLRRQSF